LKEILKDQSSVAYFSMEIDINATRIGTKRNQRTKQ